MDNKIQITFIGGNIMAGTKGNSGRPRKPTQLKILQGTYQKCRANPNEPKPKVAIPKAPSGINRKVRAKFKEIADMAYKMGILSEFDADAIHMCATALVEYYQATAVLLDRGPDIEFQDKDGNPQLMRRSELAWADGAYRRASSMLARFGLSPADRSRVDVINPVKPKGTSKWDKYK